LSLFLNLKLQRPVPAPKGGPFPLSARGLNRTRLHGVCLSFALRSFYK